MKSTEFLQSIGIKPMETIDAWFNLDGASDGNGLIGTYNEGLNIVCVTIEDNKERFLNGPQITLDEIKEIAYSLLPYPEHALNNKAIKAILYTDFGIDLHSVTKQKNNYLKKLQIKRLTTN